MTLDPTNSSGENGRYWSDAVAERVLTNRPGRQVVATGITPSGPIHLGNIREVLTGDAVYRSLRAVPDQDVELVYIADTFDPLRKVYPFLPESFSAHVGKPLYAIPDPEGCCANYAEHYLKPFLEALEELGVKPTVFRAHEMYQSGQYNTAIDTALRKSDEIRQILGDISGRELEPDWIPYNPECQHCARIDGVKPISVDLEAQTVSYSCVCGHDGEVGYMTGKGKLPWRIDWPARWNILGVTVEPFGKDHAAAGGSYESSLQIVQKVFGSLAPEPIVYEWIYLKGQGAMASSTGVAISISEMLAVAPPEAVRLFVLRPLPERHIDFDPGHSVPKMVDEVAEFESKYFGSGEVAGDPWSRRVYEVALPGTPADSAREYISYGHLATALQTGGGVEGAMPVLHRSGYALDAQDQSQIEADLARVSIWLDKFAPEAFKFTVLDQMPATADALSVEQLQYLKELATELKGAEWEPQALHDAIFSLAKSSGLAPKKAFQAIYLVLIGKNHGPRAGYFVASLARDFVCNRLNEAFLLNQSRSK